MIPLLQRISDSYDICIQNSTDAPRQFVAETYIIHTENQRFFCKVISKPLFLHQVEKSLPVTMVLSHVGFNEMAKPILTKNNMPFVINDGSLIALFEYVDAPQSYEYDAFTFGKLIAKLHNKTEEVIEHVKEEISTDDFQFEFAKQVFDHLKKIAIKETNNQLEKRLALLISNSIEKIKSYLDTFQRVTSALSSSSTPFVLTHGDAPGNILVKSPTDLCIVDWDGLQLAPAERDLVFMADHLEFLRGYHELRPQYVEHENARKHAILSRFFHDLQEYVEEIQKDHSHDHREKNLIAFEKYLSEETGWIHPFLRTTI